MIKYNKNYNNNNWSVKFISFRLLQEEKEENANYKTMLKFYPVVNYMYNYTYLKLYMIPVIKM